MEDNYPKAYKEVIEILNFVPKESVDKIPQTMIDTLKKKMDENHDFKVDINKSFEEQNLLDETKAIFANIYRDYWAIPYQKKRIEAKEKYDRQKMEEEKKTKYNPDDIFNKKNKLDNEGKIEESNTNSLPIEVKKEKFYEKIISFFKKVFHISQEFSMDEFKRTILRAIICSKYDNSIEEAGKHEEEILQQIEKIQKFLDKQKEIYEKLKEKKERIMNYK